jgi:hypothetical protein
MRLTPRDWTADQSRKSFGNAFATSLSIIMPLALFGTKIPAGAPTSIQDRAYTT